MSDPGSSTPVQGIQLIGLPTDVARARGKLVWAGRLSADDSESARRPLHNVAAGAIHQSGRVEIQ